MCSGLQERVGRQKLVHKLRAAVVGDCPVEHVGRWGEDSRGILLTHLFVCAVAIGAAAYGVRPGTLVGRHLRQGRHHHSSRPLSCYSARTSKHGYIHTSSRGRVVVRGGTERVTSVIRSHNAADVMRG